MSLIGTLEQFSLSNVLQRIEKHGKSGLLALKQGTQWIELYLHDGRLLCIGPMRTQATLGERLLHDGVISQSVLYEANLMIRDGDRSESRFARTLMELGHISREDLRAWAIGKTLDVLNILLGWTAGEVYFEEGTPPPADRLLVSMSITSLLEEAIPVTPMPQAPIAPIRAVAPTPPPISSPVSGPTQMMPEVSAPPVMPPPVMPPPPVRTPSPDVARVPTLMSASQFLDDSSFSASSFASAIPSTETFEPVATTPEPEANEQRYVSLFGESSEDVAFTTAESGISLFGEASDEVPQFAGPQPLQAEPVMHPTQPKQIDTTFMQPEMLLWPVDLSAYREQNPRVQITPDQWRILTCVDGQTSLQQICQMLNLPPDFVCMVSGELIAEGLLNISLPDAQSMQELSPVSRELAASGLANGYVAPGYASATASPWSASLPVVPVDIAQPSGLPFETESQWGNGGNGATFIPGRGWITTPQPMQPLPSSGPLASSNGGMYAPSNGNY